ncbi:MAG: DUF4468 domain-containing protein [Dysgonomonas sp.]|nr:DUF4468 domain-containing protein [Dysgonomonas sp.]
MKNLALYTIVICSLLSVKGFAQVVKQGEKFAGVHVIQDKVTFLKEVSLPKNVTLDSNYKTLKTWATNNYGKDLFVSSVHHDPKNHEFTAKSRVELLLPENSTGHRIKMVMRYRINGFIHNDKCVFEITDISYLCENHKKNNLLSKTVRAEEFITDYAMESDDGLHEIKNNTRMSTLYFLDELGRDFESKFGH